MLLLLAFCNRNHAQFFMEIYMQILLHDLTFFFLKKCVETKLRQTPNHIPTFSIAIMSGYAMHTKLFFIREVDSEIDS